MRMESQPLLTKHDLMRERLATERSIFAPGQRFRMNIVAMFINVFLPWGVFIVCYGITSFHIMYRKPLLVTLTILACIVFWLGLTKEALRQKKESPHPSWLLYASLMVGLAIFFGTVFGYWNYISNSRPYYSIQDLKVIGHIDADVEHGQNTMDAGIFYFADGNHIDSSRSWHFKQGSVYCVAPIIGAHSTPQTASFDFWAVGKDCCSTSSSDFRCGAFSDPQARSAIRILNDEDRPFYRLAVEQTETLYNIVSTHPIFVEWTQDPLSDVNTWRMKAYNSYLSSVATFFVFSVIAVLCAAVAFSFIGRVDGGLANQEFAP